MSKCGKVLSIKLMDQEQKSHTGETFVNFKKGFVMYEDVKQAQKCISTYDISNPFGFGNKPLKVDFWQSRTDQI